MKFNKEKLKSEVVLIFVFQVFWSKVGVVLKFGWCLKSGEYGKPFPYEHLENLYQNIPYKLFLHELEEKLLKKNFLSKNPIRTFFI